ncbi:S8 family serine peptidase [Methanothermococcus sp. SCGC AD-155-N22]|nr:S8 family serine peptidase [Methanothermococcus sp. SCGC AD-155-N22]
MDEAVNTIVDNGTVVVIAAGNEGIFGLRTIGTPGSASKAITVGATGYNMDYITWFSSRGPVGWEDNEVIKPDVVAPGEWVLSTYYDNGYAYMSGTSMATPHVSGVIALMLQADPSLTPDEIEQILKNTTLDLGDSGEDIIYGAGRVNASAAVCIILNNNPNNPPIIWNATISAENQLEPVIVGTHPNATDGYDEEFDEYTQNPVQGKVIMALDGFYAKNIKRSVPPGSNVTWGLSVGVPSGTTTTLNWSKNPHPQVVLHIFNGTQELEPGCVLGEGGHSLLVVAEVLEKVSFTLELERGWNMVSLPLTPDNSSVYEIFKNITTLNNRPVVTWDPDTYTFVPVDNIEPKRGYWVFTPSNINITVYGTPINDTRINLKAGWNMIGTVGLQNLNLSLIPNQVPQRPPVTWNGSGYIFEPVTEIEPGKAAWVFVTQDTEVEIDEE